jgi:octanoyl-[GcvH]:protein N-octanoyltransferase
MTAIVAAKPDERRAQVVRLLDPAPAGERLDQIDALARRVASGEALPCMVLWRSAPALVVTRSQARLPGFSRAVGHLAKTGWPVVVRSSGGGAFPICPGTVQCAILERRATTAISMNSLYERMTRLIADALAECGLAATVGEVPDAFCPGRYDIAVGGRKLAGLAQSWPGYGAVIAEAALVVEVDPQALAQVVNRFQEATGADRRCDPAVLTSVDTELGRSSKSGDALTGIVAALERAATGMPSA